MTPLIYKLTTTALQNQPFVNNSKSYKDANSYDNTNQDIVFVQVDERTKVLMIFLYNSYHVLGESSDKSGFADPIFDPFSDPLMPRRGRFSVSDDEYRRTMCGIKKYVFISVSALLTAVDKYVQIIVQKKGCYAPAEHV